MACEGVIALVLGATGAIGKEVIRELLSSPRIVQVKVITRREIGISNDKLDEHIIDFDQLRDHQNVFSGTKLAFCCMGTTRAKAGADGFVKVDRDYVFEAAQLLKEANCEHFNLVSSRDANINSSFLYFKTKGEVEKMVTELDFPRLSIFRPALLICDREQSRPLEKVLQVFAKGFDWRNRLSIPVETVAHAMVINSCIKPSSKVEIFENNDINKLGID